MGKWDCPLGEVSFCLKTNMKTTKKPQKHNDQSKESNRFTSFKPEKNFKKKGKKRLKLILSP